MLSGLRARLRSLWLGLRRRSAVEAAMTEEFRAHIELRARDLVGSGLSHKEALAQARREFGSTERYKEEARGARGLRRIDGLRFSWLDFKLGLRMLVKYPGLTIVGGLALAFGIAVGAGTFQLITGVLFAELPIPESDRVVGIRVYNRATQNVEQQTAFDFLRWREQKLESVEDLGAFRAMRRNFITRGVTGDQILVAEITSSAFRMAHLSPVLGRPLVDTDERPGAPLVMVIGYDVWQKRLAGDAAVIGRTVRLSENAYTIVGVMPEGFGFPVADGIWVPLKLENQNASALQGPALTMFGRLAEGATLADAQRELSALGQRAATDYPATHEHLLPEVMPYPRMILDYGDFLLALTSMQVVALMLLFLICANVALLMFARTATRESEIAVRNALGASRGRIITQLFAEALVLGIAAALVGLTALSFGLGAGANAIIGRPGWRPPFWLDLRLAPATIVFSTVLAVIAAVLAGALPALKATRALGSGLQRVGARSSRHFGGVWTAVIIAQIAVTVAFPAAAVVLRGDAVKMEKIEVGFPDHEYLVARVELDLTDVTQSQYNARFSDAQRELQRRLSAEPGLAGVTFADNLPRAYHPRRYIEVNSGGAAVRDPKWRGYPVSTASVDVKYFDVLGTPVRSGRSFEEGDLRSDQGVAIVNESFVKLVLGGRNPVGRQLRFLSYNERDRVQQEAPPGPWIRIVGVVQDMGMAPDYDPKKAGIYLPAAQGSVRPLHLAMHVRGEATEFVSRLRTITGEVSPSLRISQVAPLDALKRPDALANAGFWLFVLLSCVALVLSLAAIYAITSFTVAQRTREIGIRVALGAKPRSIITAIFVRPVAQVAVGIAAGGVLTNVIAFGALRGGLKGIAGAAAYALLMLIVCLLACVVPTRRALSIQPTDALKAEI